MQQRGPSAEGDRNERLTTVQAGESQLKEVRPMCVSCGCDMPNERHGDDRNITMQQIEEAAQATGKSAQEVAANIQQAVSSRR
jgi:hypothetical protein